MPGIHPRPSRPSKPSVPPKPSIKVADEVWIGVALLHREHPKQADFSVDEIVSRVRQERLTPDLRPGVYVHAQQHCVANLPPNPGRYRMLYATSKSRRRLFRKGDVYDRRRDGSKIVPEPDSLPVKYRGLIDWYHRDYIHRGASLADRIKNDPILALSGSGKHLFGGEHPDHYVKRLREGWE